MLDGSDVVYIYDGSYQGLLTSVFEAYSRHETPVNICEDGIIQQGLLDRYLQVETDNEKANRVYNGIVKNAGYMVAENTFIAYLSFQEDKEIIILEYIRLAMIYKNNVDSYLTNKFVGLLTKMNLNTNREKHKFLGFIRFSVMEGGVQYAKIKPINNVLPLCAQHFTDRLRNIPFVIHDLNRDRAAVYDTKQLYYVNAEGFIPPEISDKEETYRELWRVFYKTICIEPRRNEKLRQQLMPKRYWDNITEMNVK